ncbi:hypothetical protein AB0451_03540 [Streptomyces sp. NPDC052000]|uniref:hypothetical protein n=1 Tax=Streptomyces sp. NPDC052000 TaxID=3155676 RepID=UPI00344B3FA8
MTTDLTAADNTAAEVAMTEAYRMEHDENAQLQNELANVRAELRACEERRAASAAENRKLRELLASGRCADCDAIAEAVDADLDDDDIDAMMRTTNDAMVHQLNDVLDIDAGLSEILTRHEGEL